MTRLPPLDFDIGAAVVTRGRGNAWGRNNVAVTGEENEPLLPKRQGESPEQARLLHVVIVVLVCCCCLGLLGAGIAAAVIGAGSGEGEGEGTTTTTTTTTTAVPLATTTLAPAPVGTTAASVTSLHAISLEFLCNVPFGNGTCRAVFTYNNPNGEDTVVPAGSNNNVEPGPPNRGQRTSFRPGFHYGGATFLWNCAAHPYARWLVRSGPAGTASTAVALAAVEPCPEVPVGVSIETLQAQRR